MQQFAVLFLFRGRESCETHILAIHVHCQNIAGAIFDIYGTPSLIFAGCWLNAISKTARCAISQRVLNFVLFASHLARKNPYGFLLVKYRYDEFENFRLQNYKHVFLLLLVTVKVGTCICDAPFYILTF